MLRIGDTAPDFTLDSTEGKIHWYEYLGDNWAILFSHPADFTPVCTTELGELAKRLPEFEARHTKVAGLSIDAVDSHKGWVNDINETQKTTVKYPILADEHREISKLYGMLDQTNIVQKGLPLTVRAVFYIGPDKKVKLILYYPASCGRNFDEIFRCLDSLQLSAKKSVTTPVNWRPGDDVIIAPAVSNDKATELFGDFVQVKPYLRFTKQPKV